MNSLISLSLHCTATINIELIVFNDWEWGVFVTIAGFIDLNEYIIVPGLPFILIEVLDVTRMEIIKRKERGDMESRRRKGGREKRQNKGRREGGWTGVQICHFDKKKYLLQLYQSQLRIHIPDLVHALACGSQVGILTVWHINTNRDMWSYCSHWNVFQPPSNYPILSEQCATNLTQYWYSLEIVLDPMG